jgi:hypothetical protein
VGISAIGSYSYLTVRLERPGDRIRVAPGKGEGPDRTHEAKPIAAGGGAILSSSTIAADG